MRWLPALAVLATGCFFKPGPPGGQQHGPFGVAQPVPLEGELSGSQQGEPSLSRNGLELYFASTRSSRQRIYVGKRQSTSEPFTHVEPFSIADEESDPAISPSGLDLYYFISGTGLQHAHRATLTASWDLTTTVDIPHVGPCDFAGSDETRLIAGSTSNPNDDASDMVEFTYDGTMWHQSPDLGLPGPGVADTAPTMSTDGLEVFYEHNDGPIANLFHATRSSVDEPFDAAEPFTITGFQGIGDPELSADGHDLYFSGEFPFRIFVAHRD